MPVVGHVTNSGKLLVGRFFEEVTAEQLISEAVRATQGIPPGTAFSSLLIFEASVQLSKIDLKAINSIRAARKAQLDDRGLQRLAGAAVIDASIDANLIMRLWNAWNESKPDPNLRFEVFREVSPALRWLAVPAAEAVPAMDETLRLSSALRRRPIPRP